VVTPPYRPRIDVRRWRVAGQPVGRREPLDMQPDEALDRSATD